MMNVLFTKEKQGNMSHSLRSPSLNKEPLAVLGQLSSHQDSFHASGDGDCSRCCRLCGGDTDLRYFGDTYVWEGIEERYDQLLYDCFGVKVSPSDCMICEWCVRALRNTEKFRALVYAAFVQASTSDIATYVSSSDKTLRTSSCQTTTGESSYQEPVNQPQQKKKQVDVTKRREARKKFVRPEMKNQRINIQCGLCGQRYPMMIPVGESKIFICSRCKKNGDMRDGVYGKGNNMMPRNMVKEPIELHPKADHRAKARPRPMMRQTNQVRAIQPKEKPRIPKGPKKYPTPCHLRKQNMRNARGDSNLKITVRKSAEAFEDDLILREILPVNLDMVPHPTECELIFKNQRAQSLTLNASNKL